MKYFLMLISLLIVSSINYDLEAQRRVRTNKDRVVKRNRVVKAHNRRVKRTGGVHYHYRHLPRRGAVVTSVHRDALTIRYRNINFRFRSGIWYNPYGTKWRIVSPPYGIRIRVLPVGYRRIVVNSRTYYYYYYGTYYIKQNNEYLVTKAPVGAEIDSLPEGYNTINVEGEEYYELDGTYYIPSTNQEDEEILLAVEMPNQ